MHTDVRDEGPFERMLTLTLAESELESAKDAAARKLSGQLKIKGFRPGKAPRAVVERMVGSDAVRSEAIDDALPALVTDAINEIDVLPVTTPRVEEIRDADDGGVEVDVRITLWPTIDEIPEIDGRTVEVELPAVEDEELESQLERLQNQFAELDDVTREADEGDFVTVNLTAQSTLGRDIEDVAANDLLYEIGSRSFITGLDEMLMGASAGDIREGPGTLPPGFGGDEAQEVTLKVLVKGVKAKRLPEVTDEWVSDVTEFDTVAELRGQLGENILAMKLNVVRGSFREQALLEITDELEVALPDALIDAEMEASLHNLAHSLEGQGIDLQNYLRITGQDEAGFVDDVRLRARQSLKTRILLEAVAEKYDLEVDDTEIDEVITELAESSSQEADEVRTAIETSGQEQALTGDILRRKALDRILESVTPVDGEGNPVDLSIPEDDVGPADDTVAAEATDEESEPDADKEHDADVVG